MVGEDVQPLILEVAVEEVLQVLQVQLQVHQVEEELQVGEVLHAHCLLVPASLPKIVSPLNCSMSAKASNNYRPM